jgi:hypothetical protein
MEKNPLLATLGKHEVFTPINVYPPITLGELASAAGAPSTAAR